MLALIAQFVAWYFYLYRRSTVFKGNEFVTFFLFAFASVFFFLLLSAGRSARHKGYKVFSCRYENRWKRSDWKRSVLPRRRVFYVTFLLLSKQCSILWFIVLAGYNNHIHRRGRYACFQRATMSIRKTFGDASATRRSKDAYGWSSFQKDFKMQAMIREWFIEHVSFYYTGLEALLGPRNMFVSFRGSYKML